jgi:chromosome partitioning protein
VINQKGGCGKTTTAINLAAAFAALDQRVLLVDMDPQSHCALGLAVPEQQIEHHVGEAMLHDEPGAVDHDELIWQITNRLDLIPSTVALAGVERKLAEAPDRDLRLARVLSPLRGRYDMCVIDCPPSIGLLTFNALRAAGEVLIPVETGYFALKGASRQVATLRVMSRQCGHAVHVHVLPTMYDTRLRMGREIVHDLQRQFGDAVLPLAIHYNSKLKEAASFGTPINEFDPASRGSQDFEKLAAHLLGHVPPSPEMVMPHQMSDNQAVVDAADRALGASRAISSHPNPMPNRADALPVPTPMPTASDRASELVHRARALAARTAKLQARIQADPQVARVVETEQRLVNDPARRDKLQQKLARLYGVRRTDGGVLFVQPLNGARRVNLAGDFNNWRPEITPLSRNEQLGVWEGCVKLEPGRYRYRLVVDGRWITDPHNTYVESNGFGELNNILEIE